MKEEALNKRILQSGLIFVLDKIKETDAKSLEEFELEVREELEELKEL